MIMEEPNLLYINELSGGNKDFEAKLIAIIKIEFPQEKMIYLKNVALKNFKDASENVHKIKHKISILGLENSYEIAAAFENNLLEDSTELQEEFESILNVITKFLQQL